jgi:hypothetical protein
MIQVLLEWIFVGNQYETYIQNPLILLNAKVIIEKVCVFSKENNIITLIRKKNLLEYLTLSLKNLVDIHDNEHGVSLCETFWLIMVKWKIFEEEFFKDDKVALVTMLSLIQNIYEDVHNSYLVNCSLFLFFFFFFICLFV